MNNKELENLLKRAENWLEQAQAELVQVGRDMGVEIGQGACR